MADDEIENILADFRGWLREHGDAANEKPLDLLAVVDEFTALRHEVKLLTKATRGQTEQTGAVLEKLAEIEPAEAEEPAEDAKPVLLAVLESLDTLERACDALNKAATPPPPLSWWRRMFAAAPVDDGRLSATAEGLELSRQRLVAALRRVECEPIDAVGALFDPEMMEALEAIAVPEEESGTVIESVRTGYIWRDKVLRYAQVRVAK